MRVLIKGVSIPLSSRSQVYIKSYNVLIGQEERLLPARGSFLADLLGIFVQRLEDNLPFSIAIAAFLIIQEAICHSIRVSVHPPGSRRLVVGNLSQVP